MTHYYTGGRDYKLTLNNIKLDKMGKITPFKFERIFTETREKLILSFTVRNENFKDLSGLEREPLRLCKCV